MAADTAGARPWPGWTAWNPSTAQSTAGPAGSPGAIWAAVWPKLLAIAGRDGVWQLVHLSGWKSDVLPGPATVFSDLWEQMHHALLWQAIATTMRRAAIGFGLALVIGSVIGALVSRIKPLRAAVGSMITALQTMPSIAWFPFAIILFGVRPPPPSCSSSCWARRRRSPTG